MYSLVDEYVKHRDFTVALIEVNYERIFVIIILFTAFLALVVERKNGLGKRQD